jgi:hypothetical protein
MKKYGEKRKFSVGIVMSYGLHGPCSIFGKCLIFLFFTASRPTLALTQPLIQRAPVALSPDVKRQWREADHLASSSAEIKRGGAIPPVALMFHGIVLN